MRQALAAERSTDDASFVPRPEQISPCILSACESNACGPAGSAARRSGQPVAGDPAHDARRCERGSAAQLPEPGVRLVGTRCAISPRRSSRRNRSSCRAVHAPVEEHMRCRRGGPWASLHLQVGEGPSRTGPMPRWPLNVVTVSSCGAGWLSMR